MKQEQLATIAEEKLKNLSGSLKDFRATHLELFKKQGVKHDPEGYQFTALKRFLDEFELSDETTESSNLEDENFFHFLLIDGKLQHSPQIAGLQVKAIDSVLNELTNTHPLSELQLSLTQGIVLEIDKNTKLSKPLRITHLSTKTDIQAPTLVLKLGTHAEVSLLEEAVGSGITLAQTLIDLAPGASLEHVQLSRGKEHSLQHAENQVSLKKDARYRHVVLHLGGKLNRRNVNLDLLESGAHAESYNLYLTDKSEHSDISTQIQHRAADTTSDQIAKGILDGESKGIFTGKIHIHPKAQRVASGQLNKNLLLSKKAQAHSQPQLEIFADDVKCSHGSTTGQLSPDEIFYFQARGIPADKARTLLAHGFGLEVVMKIENSAIRDQIEELVLKALQEKFQLGGDK